MAALEILCSDMAEVLGVPVKTDLEPVAVQKVVALTLYRTAQETFPNSGEYAHGSQVELALRYTGPWLPPTVHGDGRGFLFAEVGHGHQGLHGRRVGPESHGGRLLVNSAPGRGTTVTAEVPVQKATG